MRVRTFTHISSCSAVQGMAYKLAVVGPAGVGCVRAHVHTHFQLQCALTIQHVRSHFAADEYLGLPPRGVIGSPRNLS